METILDKHWHHVPAEEVAHLLGVETENGLDRFEVEKRLDHFGENVITTKKQKSAFQRFMLQFHQPLVYILIMAGVVTSSLGELVDSSVIFGVVLINAIVGFVQESKAVKALSSLAQSMSVEATALRAGASVHMPAAGLVPGDVVLLRSGDKVPADMRIFTTKELRVDESALTGESVPVNKGVEGVAQDSVLADRTCMAYAGTLVSYGQGRGVVVATGDRTEIGRISGMIDSAKELETPLTRKISKFSHILLVAILGLAGLTFALGVMRDEPAAEMFMAAVALAVGAIPEGLPAAVTIILAIGVTRMAQRRAIIRKLPAVETLGGTTIICSDKTGTLTENQMTVQEIYSDGLYAVSGGGYSPEGEVSASDAAPAIADNQALRENLLAGLLCNDANIVLEEGRRTVEGDPTEGALLVSAEKFGLVRDEEKRLAKRVDDLPFESELQYMATLHERDGHGVVYMKGAVERVLECCSEALRADGTTGPVDMDAVVEAQHDMAGKGLRVLALARKQVVPDDKLHHDAVTSGMVLLGIQGMIDPPREEAKVAVAACQDAGVHVKMITGDHAVTAQAIGVMLGLKGQECTLGEDCPVMTGKDIAAVSDEELVKRVREVPVFARVSPEQKLRLVMAMQANGDVCAMTGDGVNDAPALKQADIGVAMGVTGTDAAKDAADMILTDDNFATIKAAVEEGRGVFANLIKYIAWTLPTNAGEGLVILTAVMLGITLPILPVQILWINMTTALCLGMMLAFEPKEPGIMERPPRRPDRPILGKVIMWRIALVSGLLLVSAFALFQWEIATGETIEKARTMAVNVFIVVKSFYLLNARSFTRSPFELGFGSNPFVIGGFCFMLFIQALFTYVPFMNTMFQSAPITLLDWAKLFVCGIAVYLLVEWDKKRVDSSGV